MAKESCGARWMAAWCPSCYECCGHQWKRLIDRVYPRSAGEPLNGKALGSFEDYIELYPRKLPKVGLYLERLVEADLVRKRPWCAPCSRRASCSAEPSRRLCRR
jgi:hypothetical protein